MYKPLRTASLAAGLLAALTLGSAALSGAGQAPEPKPSTTQKSSANLENWWKNAVIYEIYPRSFQDSNGDGIGDLNGITKRLDYLEKLGVDAIWLSPCYPSPQVDFGYDISDYKTIAPEYGTLADFDRLVSEANKHHIRIVMDMVMNHTSDKHKWFLESRSSKTNPYRDWYVWKDGKGETATDKGAPPNNWLSEFGHSAWEWDEKTRQYYYHKFYIQQPDVNWDNPKIHEAFKDVMNFWYKHGVVGFRYDAITTLYEDPTLADEDYVKDANGNIEINPFGDKETNGKKTEFLPGVTDVMVEFRAASDKFPATTFPGRRILIGETYVPTIEDLAKLYGTKEKPEFHLPMDTQIGFINKLDVATFRAKLNDAETKLDGNIPLLVFDNHDNPRLDKRYGDGVHDDDITRVISTVLFASRGASLFYYGAELGMKTTDPTRKEDVKDPVGITGWPKYKGRDGERTPMQWDESKNAGFSTGSPWLPVPDNKSTINVRLEESDPNSLLHWYETLIKLKKTVPALAHGENVMLNTDNNKVLCWLRKGEGSGAVVVATNFTADPQTVSLSGASAGVTGTKLKTLLKTPGAAEPASIEKVELPGFGVYVGEVQ